MQIQEITLQTASITRTRQFYTRTLELPVVTESAESITFRAGNTLLVFRQVQGGRPFYHFAFNITNNKFSDSYDWIDNKLDILEAEHGLPIASYPAWNAESFYFLDNNGSILEFITRFDLPYYSPAPFAVSDIREISEIGIVTNNVSATAEMLHTKYDIPYFPKSKPAENFTVLGDDTGLLIITSEGRGWVPTHRPAQIFPLSLKIDGRNIEMFTME